jgi:hypothetical protein
MSELRRLVDDPDASALEVSLLTAARLDAPSAESRRACAAALGLAAVGATAGAASAKAALGAGAAWKWLGVLALVGAVTGGLLYQSRRGGDAIDAPLATPSAAVAPKTSTPSIPSIPSTPTTTTTTTDRVAAPAMAELPPAPPAPIARTRRTERAAAPLAPNPPPVIAAPPEPLTIAAPPIAPAVTPAPTSRLAEEVALLDTARDALSAGDVRAASTALATHLVEFQQGLLVPESEILRIEVQLRRGRGPAAAALATRFLERFPNNALAKRARTLLERALRL